MQDIFHTVKERFAKKTAALSEKEVAEIEQALHLLRQKIIE